MAKEEFNRSKPHLNIWVIGHTGHGKTTLTMAINRTLERRGFAAHVMSFDMINKASQEREKGIVINMARVGYETESRCYTQIDCSAHIDYVKGMITGATQMDGAILVVSATEGPELQTREQLLLARQINVPGLVVFVNKCDMVEPSILELVEMQTRSILDCCQFDGDNIPIVYGSALKALEPGDNKWVNQILKLTEYCDEYIPRPVCEADKPFLLPVEDVYTVMDRGTIVTGRMERGMVKVGDEAELIGMGSTKKTMVTSIEMFRKMVDFAEAGENVSVLLRAIDKNEVYRGQVVARPESVGLHKRFNAEVYVLTKEEGGRHTVFFNGYRPQFHFRSADVTGSIELPPGVEMVMPGDNLRLEVELIYPVPLETVLRFTIREGGRIVGSGVLTEILE